jgi:aryl-alcohol dehydrogenase-like predicted oxidoreductase
MTPIFNINVKGLLFTVQYHGHGSSEAGRMGADMMKQFMPEEERTKRIVAAVKTVADEVGRSMAQVALAWLRSRPLPVSQLSGHASSRSFRTTSPVSIFRFLPTN